MYGIVIVNKMAEQLFTECGYMGYLYYKIKRSDYPDLFAINHP
jgi:hypothetical protein